MEKLALIMPIYNESEIIEEVIKSWNNVLKELDIDYNIHAYNDGSVDDTLKILINYSATNKRIKVYNNVNSGHGPTILNGYLDNIDAEWIFQVDSDNELQPTHFQELWNKRGAYDILVGKRINRKTPVVRRIVSWTSRITIWTLFGKGIYDVNIPYRLFRTSVFKSCIEKIPSETFAPNLLISRLSSKTWVRFFETPIEHKIRQTGKVSINRWKLVKVSLISLYQTFLFKFNNIGLTDETEFRVFTQRA